MSTSKQTTIWCDRDGCNEWVQIDTADTQLARRLARRDYDWCLLEGEDLCPKHHREVKP